MKILEENEYPKRKCADMHITTWMYGKKPSSKILYEKALAFRRKHIVLNMQEKKHSELKNILKRLEKLAKDQITFYIRILPDRKVAEERSKRLVPKGKVSDATINAALRRLAGK